MNTSTRSLRKIDIHPDIFNRLSPADQEAVDAAISDVVISNSFVVLRDEVLVEGPFTLILSDEDGRLGFDTRDQEGQECGRMLISLAPFRRHIRDYLMICDSYNLSLIHI